MEQHETSVSTPVTTRSAGIRYGLISGLISVVYFLVLSVSGINMAEGYWSWIGYLVTAAIIFLAHKYFKKNTDGFMSYAQGIGIAFWLGLIGSIISSVFTYIYVKFVDPTFMQMIRDKQVEDMEARGMSDEQIDQAMQYASMFTSPEALLIFGLIGGIIITVIVSLIVTIFTQKRAPEQSF